MPPRALLARTCWLPWALVACTPVSLDLPTETETGTTGTTAEVPATTSGPGMTSTTGGPSSTTGADTSGSSGSSDEGVIFLLPTDFICISGGPEVGWSAHCTFECDVSTQDCPRGEKCMPWANDGGEVWNGSRCSPVFPEPVPAGGACTVEAAAVSGVDDCAVGSMCWGVDPETLQGTCIEFCDPLRMPSRTCTEPSSCVPLNDGYVPVCLTPCDPLQDAPCPEGEACRNVESDGGFHCLPLVGGHVEGSSQHCEDATCLPSQVCAPADALGTCEAASCCTELCDLGDPGADAQCAAIDPALACEAFYEPGAAPAGLELVGACIVPI